MDPSTFAKPLRDFADYVTKDKHAELECKVLAGKIHTKDVADRIVDSIKPNVRGGMMEDHHAVFSYADGLRVQVAGAENIHKVCTTGSFRGVPLIVERKRRYFEVVTAAKSSSDMIDLPDQSLKFTLRHEEFLRKDFSGSPMDSASHVRILHRKSWMTLDGICRYDISTVKSKTKATKTFHDILRQSPNYEIEVEVVDRTKTPDAIVASFVKAINPLIAAHQGSPFPITNSDMEKYRMEFQMTKVPFLNPVTLERRHLRADRTNNILKNYTVTNKADGDRCFLVVMRDKRVIRVTPNGTIAWTGMEANDDSHVGDVLDGEYLSDRSLFCIFDTYVYRKKDVRRLPLLVSEQDSPSESRMGCAKAFVADLSKDFTSVLSATPMRVVTKLYLSGDGPAMEEAIRKMLDTHFEYPTDGLVFTPRRSPVGPDPDVRGRTWLTLYKWKPASKNSIDFLVKIKPGENLRSVKGTLYVSRSPGDVVRPCETMTGEYVEPPLPPSVVNRERIPSPFQPQVPRAPDAQTILIPMNERGIPVDMAGIRVEDNTIIECVYDTEKGMWNVLRTRYDKTYEYRVLNRPQFGNDIHVADSIWTNIHVPITEQMMRDIVSNPPDDTFEDDLYYRDNLDARDRVLRDVYGFHNRIKDDLYRSSIKTGGSLLELAVGRAGDLLKWKRTKPSKVVGFDMSSSCINSPRQGACIRYLKEKANHPADYLPPVLFVCGDMTKPLFEGEDISPYAKILAGTEPASTSYLSKFAGVTSFDTISCQFAVHYACESEETFRAFAKNLVDHGKGLFFGTCLDGASVYALLMGKAGHMFRAGGQVFGEFVKEYDDGQGWTETFGQAISVHLESFEQPQKEYLVPFEKMKEVLVDVGYDLVGSTMFADHYADQNGIVLTQDHQAFSFLHRSFVFEKRKVETPKIEEVEVETKEEVTLPTTEPEAAAEPTKPVVVRKKKIAKPADPEAEPVLFFGADEGKGEWRMFSNMYDAPFQIDGVTFPTVEHYFQWSKAKQMGDGASAEKIMKTKTPKSVKALGKKVADFNQEAWDGRKDEVMRAAVKAKVIQHPDILAKLQETGNRMIGEANARDSYWGIGTGPETAKAKTPSKWPGKNVLGKILMEIRGELKM